MRKSTCVMDITCLYFTHHPSSDAKLIATFCIWSVRVPGCRHQFAALVAIYKVPLWLV